MISLSLQWALPAGLTIHDGHDWRSVIAKGDDDLPAELFNRGTHLPSPFRFHALGRTASITAWTPAATKLLEGLTIKLHTIVDAWCRSRNGASPTLAVKVAPIGIQDSPRVYAYKIPRLVVIDRTIGKKQRALPADHPWRHLSDPNDCPELLTHLEDVIRRGLVRQATLLGLDFDPDAGIAVTNVQRMRAAKAHFDGAPAAHILVACDVEFGFEAKLDGPWSVGGMASRGYGQILQVGR